MAKSTKTLKERVTDLETKLTVLDFDERAFAEYDRLRRSLRHIGTLDLKIAAIAIVHNATLLNRNSKDFGLIPNLQVEDWLA